MHSHIHPIPSPLWVLDLLCDKVEGVPSGVGEQSRVQSQCNVAWILRGAIKQALEVLCLAWITHLLSYYGITIRISFLISIHSLSEDHHLKHPLGD